MRLRFETKLKYEIMNDNNFIGSIIDVNLLEKVKYTQRCITARCPACAEIGADKTGNHLSIFPDGKYSCILHTGSLKGTHSKRIYEIVGTKRKRGCISTIRIIKHKPIKNILQPVFHNLRHLTIAEMTSITEHRGWCTNAGIQLLAMRGLVFYCEESDELKNGPCENGRHPSWVIKDSSGLSAQARRLDCKKWFLHGKEVKAKTLAGSVGSYPIGSSAIGNRSTIVLCEGGPDFLATLTVAFIEEANYNDIAPLCMTGAGNVIKDEYLHYLAGKKVIIPAHIDEKNQGIIAANNWYRKIKEVALDVKRIRLNNILGKQGEQIKDLSDYAGLLDPDQDSEYNIF